MKRSQNRFKTLLRGFFVFIGLLLIWWAITALFDVPSFLLPSPWAVAKALWTQSNYLAEQTWITIIEIVLGLFFGILFGAILALCMMFSVRLQHWVMPLVLISQAIPIFALAPLLVLWFGFGIGAKVVASVLVIFFPVVSSFFDGLRRTPVGYIDLARTMGASRWAMLRHVRFMAAMPEFGTGLRMAAAVAPIGAIIGEWVGSAGGLGFVMINSNAQSQVDVSFAALFILAVITVALWLAVDITLRHLIVWEDDEHD